MIQICPHYYTCRRCYVRCMNMKLLYTTMYTERCQIQSTMDQGSNRICSVSIEYDRAQGPCKISRNYYVQLNCQALQLSCRIIFGFHRTSSTNKPPTHHSPIHHRYHHIIEINGPLYSMQHRAVLTSA